MCGQFLKESSRHDDLVIQKPLGIEAVVQVEQLDVLDVIEGPLVRVTPRIAADIDRMRKLEKEDAHSLVPLRRLSKARWTVSRHSGQRPCQFYNLRLITEARTSFLGIRVRDNPRGTGCKRKEARDIVHARDFHGTLHWTVPGIQPSYDRIASATNQESRVLRIEVPEYPVTLLT